MLSPAPSLFRGLSPWGWHPEDAEPVLVQYFTDIMKNLGRERRR